VSVVPLRAAEPLPHLTAGVVLAQGVRAGATQAALSEELDALIAARAGTDFPPPALRRAVRDLLRAGGFKPTGRNKPAGEYLARAADSGAFPRISNLVDVCNLHSLETGLPISLLDLDRARGDDDAELVLRLGATGERFVFNTAGQEIDVGGLPVVARAGGVALANAVKDSMTSKTHAGTRDVLAVIWAPAALFDAAAVREGAERLATRYRRYADAGATSVHVLT
jgi:DNA/RNA-binding domain of Phe-tRNA-synthetase-like protein